MNAFKVVLRSLAQFLSKEKIRYAILGGVALSLYGEPRLTADIDLNVLLDKKKIDEFLTTARRYNFHQRFSGVKRIARDTGVIPLIFRRGAVNGLVDIIIAENALEYAAIKRARSRSLEGIKLPVISPEDLVVHKITSIRPRDLEDIHGILIRQGKKLDVHYIRDWLKKIDAANQGIQLTALFHQLLRRSQI